MRDNRRVFLKGIGACLISIGISPGCAPKVARVTEPMTARSTALTVRLESLRSSEIDNRAIEVVVSIKNVSAQQLELRAKDVLLVDVGGRTAMPASNSPTASPRPNDPFLVPGEPGLNALRIITFPFALIMGIMLLPFTLPGTIKELMNPDWKPMIFENAVLATLEPESDRTLTLYFDSETLNAERLVSLRVTDPSDGQRFELGLPK